MSQYPWYDHEILEDPYLTDIRFAEIEAHKNAKGLSYPTNPRNVPGTIVFMPPTHPTTNFWNYILDTCRTLDIQMYGWSWPDFQARLVARKKAQPSWDVKVLVNRNGYIDPGDMRDRINAEPFLKQKDWFLLGTGEGDVLGKNAGRIMHRKAAIVDGVWFIHGSTNFDTSSIEYQGNTLSITYDPVLCREMADVFKRTRDYNIAKGVSWCQVNNQTA